MNKLSEEDTDRFIIQNNGSCHIMLCEECYYHEEPYCQFSVCNNCDDNPTPRNDELIKALLIKKQYKQIAEIL